MIYCAGPRSLFIKLVHASVFAHARLIFLVADVIADLLLIILPIRLIYGMTDRALRRRLMFIFSTASAYHLPYLVPAVISY